MNLFLRLRISKQDRIAADVARHIRAVRAAEALDRRTHLRPAATFAATPQPPQPPQPQEPKKTAEEVACQTSHDLLESLLPTLRKRAASRQAEASSTLSVSQDSLVGAASSVVEEEASTGSDDTGVYKNIIISLAPPWRSPGRKSTRSVFEGS